MTVGSLSKDARGMMADGEVLQVTAGPWALWTAADMWALTGSTTWIESQQELDRCCRPTRMATACGPLGTEGDLGRAGEASAARGPPGPATPTAGASSSRSP